MKAAHVELFAQPTVRCVLSRFSAAASATAHPADFLSAARSDTGNDGALAELGVDNRTHGGTPGVLEEA